MFFEVLVYKYGTQYRFIGVRLQKKKRIMNRMLSYRNCVNSFHVTMKSHIYVILNFDESYIFIVQTGEAKSGSYRFTLEFATQIYVYIKGVGII